MAIFFKKIKSNLIYNFFFTRTIKEVICNHPIMCLERVVEYNVAHLLDRVIQWINI